MGIRLPSGRLVDSCLAKLKPGEPFFVLRAQDLSAPTFVMKWASDNRKFISREKYEEAVQQAFDMQRWGNENGARNPT